MRTAITDGGPFRSKNTLSDPILTALQDGDLAGKHFLKPLTRGDVAEAIDHGQRCRQIKDQSLSYWDYANGAGKGPELYPEDETFGDPVESNSSSRDDVHASPFQSQTTHRQSARDRTRTRKAREMDEKKLLMRGVRGSSNKVEKKWARKSGRLQRVDSVANVVQEVLSSPAPGVNKFLDNDGGLLFPTIREFLEMTESDNEEWQRAATISGP
ncbi:hypothetical protein FALBO_4617 [Fusarium albosuccineum]|uniref:Uncharacterized protein n=1 Tax=Fusarium albosuccineum TaxID=1237068 RepID=A0A8H4LHM2_9HYPO|nr:hypothetical protein FALBO_4617 [Fusarium albosuccineum]